MRPLGFPRSRRLLCSADFAGVMDKPDKKFVFPLFILFVKKTQLPQSRIGFIIAKKYVRLAVNRCKVKRVCRESFRLKQVSWQGLDIVFMARTRANNVEKRELRLCLETAWENLQNWLATA